MSVQIVYFEVSSTVVETKKQIGIPIYVMLMILDNSNKAIVDQLVHIV